MHRLSALVLIVLFPAFAGGAILKVPGDHESIQAAVDASAAGDTILISPGGYVENLDIAEKGPLTLIGSEGPEKTLIDGDEKASVVLLNDCLGTITLEGLTITRGYNRGFGAGLLSQHSNVAVRDCQFLDNTADSQGGGICLIQCTRFEIDRCQFERNESDAAAAISVVGGRGTVSRSTFRNNTGGLVLSTEFSGCDIRENLFVNNLSTGIGVVACLASLAAVFENNTVAMNLGKEEYGAVLGQKGDLRIERNVICQNEGVFGVQVESPDELVRLKQNNVWQNEGGAYKGVEGGEGDLSVDPLFCDPENNDFRLKPGSPCLPDEDRPIIGARGKGCN